MFELTFPVFVVLQPTPIDEHFGDASIVHELRNEDKEDLLSHNNSWLFTAEVKSHSFHNFDCFPGPRSQFPIGAFYTPPVREFADI